MATNSANILMGPAIVSLAPWISNPAAGSPGYVDLGHTMAPPAFTPNFTDVEIKSEQAFGVIKKVPVDATYTVKIQLLESTIDPALLAMLRQAASKRFGTTPNFGVYVGAPTEQYHVLKAEGQIAGTGLGTNFKRRWRFWKLIVSTLGDVKMAKAEPVMFDVTFTALYDDSITANNEQFARIEDF